MKFGKLRIGMTASFVLAAAIASAQAGISVTINGQAVQFPGQGPQMVNGRVLVPLRGVFENLGAHVEWHPDRHEVVAARGQASVDLQIGNPSATVNGQEVRLDVPAQIVNGSTMVPIRFVSEAIGAQVRWNQAEQLVIITMDMDQAPSEQPAPDRGGDGPIRMARISYVDGDVMWRPGDDVDWSGAASNMPLREGAEFWLNPNGREEVQFDDGSFMRLGNGAVSTLQTMYADGQGEFTEIRLNTGTASLRLTNGISSYQVDTPLASVVASGQSSFRVDASNGLRVVVRSGSVRVQGDAGQLTVSSGEYLRLANANSPYVVVAGLNSDAWDRFCDGRDGAWHPSPNLPSSIALVGGDLDNYGTWVRDPQYGTCWRPNGTDAGWAPYRNGHWVWVSPFGWTWCGNEPWGWAPYHYGTWFPARGGWLWRPGPAQQCWSPAVVHFSTDNGNIAWCPLAPSEVRYPPAVSIGFRAGNWAVNFSIGGAASYYPAGPNYCAPHAWSNSEINHTTNVYNVTRITNVQNVYVSNSGFVPRNSSVPGGATVASTSQFAGRGQFTRGNASAAAIFAKGKSFAPPSGEAKFAGPTNVKPTAASFSPAPILSGARPNPTAMNRPVVRSPLPGQVASAAKPMPAAHTARTATIPPMRTTAPILTNPAAPFTPPTNPNLKNPRGGNPKRGNRARQSPNQGNPAQPGLTPPPLPVVKPGGFPNAPVHINTILRPTSPQPEKVNPVSVNPPRKGRANVPPKSPGDHGKKPPHKPGEKDKQEKKDGG